jgi:hypothetical protein
MRGFFPGYPSNQHWAAVYEIVYYELDRVFLILPLSKLKIDSAILKLAIPL